MTKDFSPAELAEMRADLERNPGRKGLGVVAQLHDCKQEDVIAALGLDPADYARKPKVKVSPEQKADAVARAARGEPLADIAGDLGVDHSTVTYWIRQAKTGTTARLPKKPATKEAHPRQAVRLSEAAQVHLEAMDAAIDYMRDTRLLDDEDARVLEQYLAAMAAFVRGLEYAEECNGDAKPHNRMEVQ